VRVRVPRKKLNVVSPRPAGITTGFKKKLVTDMSDNDCSICLEEITAATGKTVLGCGHGFHLRCAVRWFLSLQGAASTCPCCRRESGHLDDVPTAEEAGGSGSDSDYSGSDSSSDSDSDHVSDSDWLAAALADGRGTVRLSWTRQSDGTWKGVWVLENSRIRAWDPAAAAAAAAAPAPAEITEGAIAMQRLWRGYQGRGKASAMAAAISLVKMSQGPAPAPAPAPWEWIAGALDNDPEWEDHAEVAETDLVPDIFGYVNRIHVINNYHIIDHDRMRDEITRFWARINAMSDDDE
jgi:hypothetical protein